ncbi:MAG: DUF507 family protein [Candidatus Nitrohelix vancouverensis]|uniref:DUF507 family protein n=1 Tax=Candidatus Nitrohelix vancouverensis TaxID=2705534 RepID=A0A7T0G423_9BACT|nr:MAG: DUF507 family protein [Candidatus Nitrohelix vancouverensis]
MKISRDKVNHISSLIISDFKKRSELDYKVDLNDIRLEIAEEMLTYLKMDDNADAAARGILASYSTNRPREGTSEWEILYQKHYEEYMNKHDL